MSVCIRSLETSRGNRSMWSVVSQLAKLSIRDLHASQLRSRAAKNSGVHVALFVTEPVHKHLPAVDSQRANVSIKFARVRVALFNTPIALLLPALSPLVLQIYRVCVQDADLFFACTFEPVLVSCTLHVLPTWVDRSTHSLRACSNRPLHARTDSSCTRRECQYRS